MPPEFAHYLEKNDVFRTLENLMQNLLIDKPDDPLEWMIQFLKGPEGARAFTPSPPSHYARTHPTRPSVPPRNVCPAHARAGLLLALCALLAAVSFCRQRAVTAPRHDTCRSWWWMLCGCSQCQRFSSEDPQPWGSTQCVRTCPGNAVP